MNQKTDFNYELLSAAIIKQAISDYKLAMKKSIKKGVKSPVCIEVEKFFKSAWGEYLCMGHNIVIYEKLIKETKDENIKDFI